MTVAVALSLAVGGCAWVEEQERPGAEREQLDNSLRVASASANVGQLRAAERLYTELSRHFPDAPEPRIGLGYLALRAEDFTLAGKFFNEAAERSTTPAAKAEALLGAGRAGLGEGDVAGAKTQFLAASELAKGTPGEAWVANGLGVVGTLEGDHARAQQYFDEAVKLSPSHPMFTSNLVRALLRSGKTDEARRLYAKYSDSHWLEGDAADLPRLIEEAKVAKVAATASAQASEASPSPVGASAPAENAGPAKASLPAAASDSGAASPPGVQVQIYAARSQAGALAAWKRLSAAEQDLLGSLSPQVSKISTAKKAVFYRLRVGPLADGAAAKRLCGALKDRRRDCFVPAGQRTARGSIGATRNRAAAGAGALVQLHAARSRAGALAAWRRFSAAEEELLGSLAPIVVKVQVPEQGVFYRLFVAPLADKAAARRLCGSLKARGRDCFVRTR